jgi:hypothetical protein
LKQKDRRSPTRLFVPLPNAYQSAERDRAEIRNHESSFGVSCIA